MEDLFELEEMIEEDILDSVYRDWFPNVMTEEDLEYELECASWNND
jgi:hypothetical protein